MSVWADFGLFSISEQLRQANVLADPKVKTHNNSSANAILGEEGDGLQEVWGRKRFVIEGWRGRLKKGLTSLAIFDERSQFNVLFDVKRNSVLFWKKAIQEGTTESPCGIDLAASRWFLFYMRGNIGDAIGSLFFEMTFDKIGSYAIVNSNTQVV